VKTRNLIVLNETIMPAILIECLFADSDDADKYDPEVIARAIINGLVSANNPSDGEWKAGWNKNDVGWWYCTDIENKYYYTSQNGWQEIEGEWYIFDDRGYALQNCWYHDKNNNIWYYLDENCKMVMGSKEKPLWKWINGKCYAFDQEGRMYCNCVTTDGYKVDENGVCIN
ncbi:N-acetylmuramoyl-L-alanine amidase, partial [Clostridium sp. 2-1]